MVYLVQQGLTCTHDEMLPLNVLTTSLSENRRRSDKPMAVYKTIDCYVFACGVRYIVLQGLIHVGCSENKLRAAP